MKESEIIAKHEAKVAEKKEADTKAREDHKKEVEANQEHVSGVAEYEEILELQPALSYFEINESERDEETMDKVRTIWKHAKADGPAETLLNIKELKSRLGNSGFTPPLDRLYNYVRALDAVKEAEKVARAYER